MQLRHHIRRARLPAMPLYSDGPLSKWYPSCTQACAAPPGMLWLSTTVTCRAARRRLGPGPARPPAARPLPASAAPRVPANRGT